jgi:hypothetical protein
MKLSPRLTFLVVASALVAIFALIGVPATAQTTKPSWYLVDADKGYNDPASRVRPLGEGDTVILSEAPAHLNVEYVPQTTARIGSVRTLDNGVRRQVGAVEGNKPWSIGGDDSHGRWNAIVLEPGKHALAGTCYANWNAGPVLESSSVNVTVLAARPPPPEAAAVPVTNLVVAAGDMVPAVVHVSALPWLEQMPEAERVMHDYEFTCPDATGRKTLTGFNAAFRLDTPGDHTVTLTIKDPLTGAHARRFRQVVSERPDTRALIDLPPNGGTIAQSNVTVRVAGNYAPAKGWTVTGNNVHVRTDAQSLVDWTSANGGKMFAIFGDNCLVDGNGTLTLTSSGNWGVNLFEPYRKNFAAFGVTGLRFDSFMISGDPQCVGAWLDHATQPLADFGMRGYLGYSVGPTRCFVFTDDKVTNSNGGSNLRFSHGQEVLVAYNDLSDLDRRPYATTRPTTRPGVYEPDPADQRTWDFANGGLRFHASQYMWAEGNDGHTDPAGTNGQGCRLLLAPNDKDARFTFGVARNNRVQTEIRVGAGARCVRLENNMSTRLEIEGADPIGKPASQTIYLHGNAGRLSNTGAIDVKGY